MDKSFEKAMFNKRSSAVIVNIEKVCACYESFRSDYQLPSKALFFKEKAFVRQLGITSKANYPMFSEIVSVSRVWPFSVNNGKY